MQVLEDRYAVVSYPDHRLLARWLRPLEAAAYVETYNRVLRLTRCRAEMVRETSDLSSTAPVADPPPQ